MEQIEQMENLIDYIAVLVTVMLALIIIIYLKQNKMGQELDELTAAVAKDIEVDQSAITLLNGLKQKLDDAIASGNPQALKDLSASIGSSTQALADAVAANTPAEPTP